jgi:hypothetical protein
MDKICVGAVQLFLQLRIKFLQRCSPRNTNALHDVHAATADGGILRFGQ